MASAAAFTRRGGMLALIEQPEQRARLAKHPEPRHSPWTSRSDP
jgi:hypothetical protein